jgi:hypothetical protein
MGYGQCIGTRAVPAHGLSNVAGSGLAVFCSKGLLPMARWWAGLEQAGSRIDACSMTVTTVCMRTGA